MARITVMSLVLTQLLACQAREQPRAPDEGAQSAPQEADADASAHAPVMPQGPQYDQENDQASAADSGSPDTGFYPESCLALKTADPSLPSGIYNIYPRQGVVRGRATLASCDMETDGGGWTLVLNYNHKEATNPELKVRIDNLPLLGSDVLGTDESLEPEHWGHAGNEMLRSLAGFRELLFFCRSSENTRVLHFKTADAACLSAVQLGRGTCANIRNEFVPMSDHSAILPAALDRAESDRLDETLTYNTFGKTEVETPARMWSIRAEPSQQAWECDYGTNNAMFHTLHRVWIR
jgi:hypothetical protein